MSGARGARESALRAALVWIFRRIIGVYFREIAESGNLPSRETRGRVFLSNHVNGLVDPILVLTHAPCAISPIAKSTLWKIPGLRFLLDEVGAVPIARRKDEPNKQSGSNDEVFDRVADGLNDGQNVLIFPEGTSHNEPHLLELKSGAARILSRAKALGARGLTFQAVALEFDARESFRSRCLLVYGPVRRAEDFDGEGELLVKTITDAMHADLAELVVEGRDWDERRLIARVVELIANDDGERSLERWNSIGRQVEAASKTLGALDESGARRVAGAVDHYYALLAREGLADEQLASASEHETSVFFERLVLFAILPFAVLGALLYVLPYPLPRFIARKAAEDPDETSTLKLGASLVVYPVWATALIVLAFVFTPARLAIAAAFVVLASPFAALAWMDRTPAIRRALRFTRKRARLTELRSARVEAMKAIAGARAELGV